MSDGDQQNALIGDQALPHPRLPSRTPEQHLLLLDNVNGLRCFCSGQPNALAEMLREINGKDWDEIKGDLRKMAYGLLTMSVQAEKNKKNRVGALYRERH